MLPHRNASPSAFFYYSAFPAAGSRQRTFTVRDRMFRRIVATLFVFAWAIPAAAQGRLPGDAIDMSQVKVYNSPADVASWPVTTAITQLVMRPRGVYPDGISLTFSAQQTWPDYWPPGWDGPLQYTVWAVVRINGQWYTSGFIQMWRTRASTGAPILTDFAINWAYDSRWGPMAGYQPQVGEQMGFFVTAGNARGVSTVTSVRERSNVVLVSLPAGDSGTFTYPATLPTRTSALDVDGDSKADISVFRPSTGQWFVLRSATSNTAWGTYQWGVNGDLPVPGDYDGDGKSDIAVFRPSTASWYILKSSSGYSMWMVYQWGINGDVPVPADYDGDGKADIVVYRAATSEWFGLLSSTNFTSWATFQWGVNGDLPVPGDYDGDGIVDVGVFRPSNGTWYLLKSTARYSSWFVLPWGVNGDIPVAGDYDGDGKTDVAVYRPSTATWFILRSSSGFSSWSVYQWGTNGDTPAPNDYDGDGKTDIAVYRPSTATWFVLKSTTSNSSWMVQQWGVSTDLPVLQYR
jgi:hypothetical protein